MILSSSTGSSILYHSALPDKIFPFSSGFNDLNHSALFCFCVELSELNHSALFCFCAVSSDLYQSADLDKSFVFLWDPVTYIIQLCEIKAFLFLQDPVTCTILLY